MPNKDTEKDLWRLAYDYNASHIVMLNSTEEDQDVYWPPPNSIATYPPLSIKCLEIHDKSSFVSKHILIESSKVVISSI